MSHQLLLFKNTSWVLVVFSWQQPSLSTILSHLDYCSGSLIGPHFVLVIDYYITRDTKCLLTILWVRNSNCSSGWFAFALSPHIVTWVACDRGQRSYFQERPTHMARKLLLALGYEFSWAIIWEPWFLSISTFPWGLPGLSYSMVAELHINEYSKRVEVETFSFWMPESDFNGRNNRPHPSMSVKKFVIVFNIPCPSIISHFQSITS